MRSFLVSPKCRRKIQGDNTGHNVNSKGPKDTRPFTDFENPYHKYTEYLILFNVGAKIYNNNNNNNNIELIIIIIIIMIIINDNFYSALSKSSKALYNQGKKS